MGRERDPLDYLSEAWRQLRLSVRCPTRVPTWDAVVLTAASPAQADLYQRHLGRAQANGIIAPQTVVLAVPDPEAAASAPVPPPSMPFDPSHTTCK